MFTALSSELTIRVPMFGRLEEPLDSLSLVLGPGGAVEVRHSESELSRGVALFGGLVIPTHGFGVFF